MKTSRIFFLLVAFLVIALLIYVIFIRKTAEDYIEMLKHGKPPERGIAVLRLRYFNSPESIKPLINAMDDPYYEIRTNAIYTLGEIGASSALPKILEKIEDFKEHSWVRQAGTRALRYLGGEEQIPLLIKLLNDEVMGVRKEAIWSLSMVAGSSAIPVFRKKLENPDSIYKEIIKYELFKVGDKNYIPFVINKLQGDKYEKKKARGLLDKYINNPCCGSDSKKWIAWWNNNKANIIWDSTSKKYKIKREN